ncbi:MAG: deoxyguanosinetriphosphate triphosphohydrolase [Armatimonadota bacterium]
MAVIHPIRERTEQFEIQWLSPHATRAAESRGRPTPESEDAVRTVFQRDRDRILHSKSFRRLKHKTQVFISPQGDHYRTRLTHTLDVAQIARTVARALRLNEDLTEAIALAHDVGHTPFGHAGESALNEAIQEVRPERRFRHFEQSVRVLTVIENDGKGLNLTFETIEGVGGHSKGVNDLEAELTKDSVGTLEAGVVRVSDRIAYLNHDIDDALRAGWIAWEDVPAEVQALGDTHGRRIGAMVTDLIEASADGSVLRMSDRMRRTLDAMKDFLFDAFYMDYARRFPDVKKAKSLVRGLFHYYVENPSELPPPYQGFDGAVDYVSGMTDRFAVRTFEELFVPNDWDAKGED